MKAIILAAGIAKRLRPLTDHSPKCLLNIGDKNLLHRTIENLTENGIDDFIFVTGYREDMIKNYLGNNFGMLKRTFLSNPDFENNNNSYSLWMAKDHVNDDVLLLDSDILFDKRIITKLLESEHENCLAVNKNVKPDEEQVKVLLNEDEKIIEIGKEVDLNKAAGESIGIARFSSYFMRELFNILNHKIVEENNVNEFYEVSFQELIEKKDERNSIFAVDVSEFNCIEVDTVEDFENAQKLII
jgi:choline kinase